MIQWSYLNLYIKYCSLLDATLILSLFIVNHCMQLALHIAGPVGKSMLFSAYFPRPCSPLWLCPEGQCQWSRALCAPVESTAGSWATASAYTWYAVYSTLTYLSCVFNRFPTIEQALICTLLREVEGGWCSDEMLLHNCRLPLPRELLQCPLVPFKKVCLSQSL